MNRCERCKVNLEESLDNCPLCGAYIEKEEIDIEEHFNDIDYSYNSPNHELILRKFFMRISIIVTFAALISVLIVDFLCNERISWSLHVVIGLFIFWLTFARIIFFQEEMRRMTVVFVLMIMFLVCYIQYCITGIPSSGRECWSLEYAAPAFQIGGLCLLCLMALIEFRSWNKYALPITLTALTSLVPFLIYYFLYFQLFFMQFISIAISLLVILLMIVFGRKKYFLEYKKKFHF